MSTDRTKQTTDTAATRNARSRARVLAQEIERDGLLLVAAEDDQYGTDQALILLALRELAGEA